MEEKNNKIDIILLLVFTALLLGVNIYLFAGKILPVNAIGIGIVIAAILTLSLYSFLYKDNPFFKIAENLFVGAGMGISVVIIWFNYLKPELYKPLIRYAVRDNIPGEPNFWLIIPMLLGLFMFARFLKKTMWLSRWSFAFIIGGGAGISIPVVIHSFILKQIEPSLQPVFVDGSFTLQSINIILLLSGTISVLIYFFFSTPHTGIVGNISRLGIWFLMVAFGASFGYTVMGRMSLLIQRIQFLLTDWLKINIQ
ncbi:MAG: hypothetical protein QME51_05695 [Planctomycetota bacterium]|nr:hypothetical protein [Planctomycetota bacterium]MDI6787845.1 hypothetical protein [Planctomycetota bacterium]